MGFFNKVPALVQQAEEAQKAEDRGISILKDPFSKDCVHGVRIVMMTTYAGVRIFFAKVEFKNGGTTGEQDIRGDSMDDVILKTKEFLETFK